MCLLLSYFDPTTAVQQDVHPGSDGDVCVHTWLDLQVVCLGGPESSGIGPANPPQKHQEPPNHWKASFFSECRGGEPSNLSRMKLMMEGEELEVGEREPLGKCPKCGRRLRRVKTPLKCSRCCETYHLKCVEGQRLAVELAMDAGTWICGECREKNVAADQEGNHPDTEVTSGARQSRGLRIIQWNCDWMATKVDELAGLVREEKPDVVVLQETKLREGDPTPHIEGCVVTRFDRKTRRPLATARGGGLAVMMREGIAGWRRNGVYYIGYHRTTWGLLG